MDTNKNEDGADPSAHRSVETLLAEQNAILARYLRAIVFALMGIAGFALLITAILGVKH